MEQIVDELIADAQSLAKSGEFEEAEKKFLSVLEIEPKSATAHYGLGTIALQCNQAEHAQICLKNAQSLEPEAVDIAYNLARCSHQLGDVREALLQLQHATKYCKADPVFCPLIADFLLSLGEPGAAIQLLSRLQVLTPSDQIILARAQAAKSNWREAVSTLSRLSGELPNDAKIANDLAVAAGKLRDFDTSISSFEHYMKLVTPSATDYLRFADLLLMAQRTERCEKAVKLAIEMGEDGAEIYVIQSKIARLNGDYKAANKALDKALERSPNDGQAWTIRAELADQDELADLIEHLQTELKNKDELALQQLGLLNYALADMQDRAGDFKNASASLVKANQAQYDHLQVIKNVYNPELTSQMMNALAQRFNRDIFDGPEIPIETSTSSVQFIFIVGMPRSGTTLVERIIGQNSQVFNGGELEAMEFLAAEFNQLTASGKLSQDLDKMTPTQWLDLRQLYFDKLPKITKPIITDKLPHNFRHVGLIHKLFPKAKVIQLHRDIKDVSLSIYSKAFSAGHNYANRWSDLAHFYSECEKLMAHWSSMNSPRILDLNYEDLVEKPDYYAKQLIQFCGFEWDHSYLDFHQSNNQSFTFSEMQVRQPITNTRVKRWQKYADYFPELAKL